MGYGIRQGSKCSTLGHFYNNPLGPKHPTLTALDSTCLPVLGREWVTVPSGFPLGSCILPGGRVKISAKLLSPVQCFSSFWLWPMVKLSVYIYVRKSSSLISAQILEGFNLDFSIYHWRVDAGGNRLCGVCSQMSLALDLLISMILPGLISLSYLKGMGA